MILVVTYELKQPETDFYEGLYEYLKSHKGWSHYLRNTWLIDTNDDPETVTDAIRERVGSLDHFLVIPLVGTNYQGWMPKKQWEWIRRHRT